jgi:hypothetical protein
VHEHVFKHIEQVSNSIPRKTLQQVNAVALLMSARMVDSHSNESTVPPFYRTKRALCQLQPWNIPTAMLILPCHAIENACNAVPLQNTPHSPCLIRSANCLFPKSHMFIRPCSERSMFFIEVMSCAGGLLTREATMTGSVSRMMPSSTSSSTASDWEGQRKAHGCSESWLDLPPGRSSR